MRKRIWVLFAALLSVWTALAACAVQPVADAGNGTAPPAPEEAAPADEPAATESPAGAPGEVEQGAAQEPTEDAAPSEEAEIYAAVIRQLYTVDHTFGSTPPNWPRVYVLSRTDDTISGSGEEPDSHALSEAVQAQIADSLADLPAEIIWVASWEEVPIDDENGIVDGGDGIIITLGNIHEQRGGTVHVPAGLHCGGLCATGMTYVLEQAEAGWQVTGTDGPIWMS